LITLIAYLTNVDVGSRINAQIHFAGLTHRIAQPKSVEYLLEVNCYEENGREGLQNCGNEKSPSPDTITDSG
jgi:hypothetical protein